MTGWHITLKEVVNCLTLPKTNSSPLKMVVSNGNLLFKGSIFRGYASFREGKGDSVCQTVEEIR